MLFVFVLLQTIDDGGPWRVMMSSEIQIGSQNGITSEFCLTMCNCDIVDGFELLIKKFANS